MFLIGFAGFTEQEPGGPLVVSQPDSATLMIRLIMVFAPFIFMGIGTVISFKYRIDSKKQHEITKALKDETIDKEDLLKSISS